MARSWWPTRSARTATGGRPGSARRGVRAGVADAWWVLRWRLSGTPRWVLAVVGAAVVGVPALLLAWAFGVVGAGDRVPPPQLPEGPVPVMDPSVAVDKLGAAWGVPALDGPRCATALTELKVAAKGRRASTSPAQVVEEVGYHAAAVGRFCPAKDAAVANKELVVPFYSR